MCKAFPWDSKQKESILGILNPENWVDTGMLVVHIHPGRFKLINGSGICSSSGTIWKTQSVICIDIFGMRAYYQNLYAYII